ncbi:hypothetical protein C8R43DRAFT_1130686 [Mycena crocata]|nr:hypothetical protein C8R43DRAFT_1130686 [Mycena crocata]
MPIVATLLIASTINALSIREEKTRSGCPSASASVELYRLFRNDIEHYLYTTSLPEKSRTVANLYEYDGVAVRVFRTQQPRTVPLYHLVNAKTQNNFYTTDKQERDTTFARDSSVVDKGIAAYIFPKHVCGSKALDRHYNPISKGYFYTIESTNTKATTR